MKNSLKTFTVTIPAGEKESSLAASGTAFTVYETNSPFTVYDDNGSLFEIDRACRVESENGIAFNRLTLVRPDGYTEKIVVKLAVGSGVRFIDGRLQYTSNSTTNTTAAFAVTALPPQVRSRFLPRFAATAPLIGDPTYSVDTTAAPKITGGTVAALNLLAPADTAVIKRLIRLTSGTLAKIGRSPSAMSTAGQFFELTPDRPEIVLDGSESTFGLAAADANLTVFETLQSQGPVAAVSNYAMSALISANDIPGNIPRFLRGAFSFTVSAGYVSQSGQGVIKFGSNALNIYGARYSGNLYYNAGGTSYDASGVQVSGATPPSMPTGGGTFTASFKDITQAEATQGASLDGGFTAGLRAQTSYFTFSLQSGSAGSTVTFGNGRQFAIPGPGAPDGFRRFRVGLPWDGSAVIYQHCTQLDGGSETWES